MPRTILVCLASTAVALVICTAPPATAAVVRTAGSRFDTAVVIDPTAYLGTRAERPEQLPNFKREAGLWQSFSDQNGGGWNVRIDRRSGVPLLAVGRGIPWFAEAEARAARLSELERTAREFVARNGALIRIDEKELKLESAGSGQIDSDHWILLFTRRIGGVPVEDERFMIFVTRGKLSAFGADRWGDSGEVAPARLDAASAQAALYTHAGITASDRVRHLEPPQLVLVPYAPDATVDSRRFDGAVGRGIAFRPAWRFTVQVVGTAGTWVGKVDASTGKVIAFFDDTHYAQVRGGVYPVSDDQQCPDGCEQADWPMPYADVTINGTDQTANPLGVFSCSPAGGVATTTLAGPYVRVQDVCGAISESATCDASIVLSQGGGTDCSVPSGSSEGNTHAARSSFYHLNRVMEKGRAWLPNNNWLRAQLPDNVNIDDICNAFWDNISVNFFKSGGGCRNTGEIAGVFVHEWGHGLDFNDGGGYDNPSEAYADIVAILQTHTSCVGRGFFVGQNCGGYGDACLNCTGIRDMDWDLHQSHTPATPAGFEMSYCPAGSGPCGKEVHCESYIQAEVLWDLATRDLPASGLDAATSWQLADKLFYKSRLGSGGNAYNCALPSSDGCAATSWFNKYRNVDDEDGDLSNGTPHAAAIYAAFARHAVACGAPTDPSNQSSSACPVLAAPVLSGTIGTSAVTLHWTPVPNAAAYLILRNDQSCSAGHTIVATVPAPATTFTDSGLANGFTEYYAVQGQSNVSACESPLSNCVGVAPQPLAGSIALDRGSYNCGSTVQVRVSDANVGASTLTTTLTSTAESAPETIVLAETPPGSSVFVGSIPVRSGPAVSGDGLLSVATGGSIVAHYVDADDGQGGINVPKTATASVDCVAPVITGTAISAVTGDSATVTWTTSKAASSIARYGPTRPPAAVSVDGSLVTVHAVVLSGLAACTTYYVSVQSDDASANATTDDNHGHYYHFETTDPFGGPCHSGQLTLDRGTSGCADTLSLQLGDIDLNLSPAVPDSVTVTVSSTIEGQPESVTLTESDVDTGVFLGSIGLTADPAAHGDELISVRNGDTVTASYRDANDGSGAAAVSYATATTDCAGSLASEIVVTNFTDNSADVVFTTDEPTLALIEWGGTPALDNLLVDYDFATAHVFTLGPLSYCGAYFFRVSSLDAYGNLTVNDAAGAPYSFNHTHVPGVIFFDGFESSSGWTLQPEWELDAPLGLGGTTPASPDPASAYAGAMVLGDDLTGLGGNAGGYEPGGSHRAASPLINATSLVSAQLQFYGWLNDRDGAPATIDVMDEDGSWETVYDSDSTSGHSSFDWELWSIDISQYADHNPSLRVAFNQNGGSSTAKAGTGWNIDNLLIRNGTLPQYDACGGCGAAPSFEGLVSARDENGCAASGITLAWDAAPSWGTGHPGTYSVYRGTTPDFIPGPTNRVATGLTATSWLDPAPPPGAMRYYLVRAENDETCSTGPANHGVTDVNLVRVAARDDASQVSPGTVSPSLRASVGNVAHIRLTWAPSGTAARYIVKRAATAAGPFTPIGDTGDAFFDDVGEAVTPDTLYYDVRAADSCGNEGP